MLWLALPQRDEHVSWRWPVADPIKKSTERVAAAVEEVEKSTDGTTVLRSHNSRG